jgi:hypothetical protein
MRARVCTLALSLVACAANRTTSRDDLIARHTEATGGAGPVESVDRIEVDLRISEGGSEVQVVWRADRQGRMRIDVHPDRDAKQKWLENRWSDYRPVAGALHAFHEEQIDVSTGEVLQRTDVTRVEVSPDFPAGLFDPPG